MTNSAMANEKEYTPISVRISESKRGKWEDYVEESDAESISHLVRIAVKHEIDGTVDEPQAPETGIASEQIAELVDGMDDLQRSLGDVQTRLSAIESEIDVADTMDIEDAIYTTLPVEGEQSEPTEEYHAWAMTAEDVAMRIARPEKVVAETLDRMEERGGQVRSVVGGPNGDDRWFFLRE
ncbi:hypothetical protein V9T20_05850 [Halobacterium salinarum]|uniref:hypothetical protein n=1 Tax=Halobacterium salinarum TaxID=2242 RepID=UPI0030D0D48B